MDRYRDYADWTISEPDPDVYIDWTNNQTGETATTGPYKYPEAHRAVESSTLWAGIIREND